MRLFIPVSRFYSGGFILTNSSTGKSFPRVEGGSAVGPICKPWGFWGSLGWLAPVLAVWMWGFDRLEHALLDGTAFGRLISNSWALGALNILLGFSVPLLILLVAVRLGRCPVGDYFGWTRPRGRHVLIGILLALALQFLYYAFFYLIGADITAAAIAQYLAETKAGTPHWVTLLIGWPAIICAPFVEETVFRGFLWRGWVLSPLGIMGTWLLTSLAFTAFHIPLAMSMTPVNAVIMLVSTLLLGLLLGWLRRRSGTTTATIIAHVAYNLVPPLFALTVGAMFAGPILDG
jgi:membrane protease YdiL (CAAX protease family)